MAARPKLAASMIAVWDEPGGARHLLMGKRHESLRFLPGYLVFPGGRLERQDWVKRRETDRSGTGLDAEHRLALDQEWVKRRTASQRTLSPSEACLRTALRECLEETGYDLGAACNAPVRYVGRAITPPPLPIRFDTRFFLIALPPGERPPPRLTNGDGELLRAGWRSLHEIAGQKVHQVTRAMLDHALAMADGRADAPLLVADRTPKGWRGPPARRSRDLQVPCADQA